MHLHHGRGELAGALTDQRTRLGGVKADTWGGWIWINLDPKSESLRDYLEPAASLLEPFELQNMRCRWRRWIVFDCNWKVAMEAFDETYHVPGTHPEFMRFGKFVGWGRPQGRHSHIGYDAPKGLDENKAKLRLGSGPDPRKSTAEMQVYTWEQVNTNTTKTLVDAAVRLVDELPEGTPADKVLKHWLDSARRDDAARGVIWPTVATRASRQERHRLADFPEFPDRTRGQQHALLQRPALWLQPGQVHIRSRGIRALSARQGAVRRNGNICRRIPRPGAACWCRTFNMAAVQQGMKNGGFRGPLPNPKSEGAVTSLHRNLAKYMGTPGPKDLT